MLASVPMADQLYLFYDPDQLNNRGTSIPPQQAAFKVDLCSACDCYAIKLMLCPACTFASWQFVTLLHSSAQEVHYGQGSNL